ncbi:S24 family peptidase [Oligella urethralis]|uniref:S24 family peptidase n=1 Tax=Oligella urethralis TaxID=90245 RepID=UPI000E00EC66|nr:S24 family peptidase [Oligella urethralis]SUA58254.1 Uncharacterized HTH-type transcriptional regulator HI_1476 [Oligella urethralis]
MNDIREIRNKNLRDLIDRQCGGSQTVFSERTGISLSQIGQWLADSDSPYARNMSERSARKIEDALNLTPMSLDTPSVSFPIADSSESSLAPAGYIRLDYLEVESSAGKGRSVDYEMPVLHKLDVLEDWAISALGRNAQDRIKIINNIGDSMAPTIQDGDILFVDVKTTTFEAEGIYVINFNDVLLTKRLIAQADGRLAIVSDNSSVYATQYISARDSQDLNICGRVRAWWSLRKY